MDLEAKRADDNYILMTVSDCRDADAGYCVYFEEAETFRVPDPRPQFVDGKRVRPGDPGYEKDAKMRVDFTYWLAKSYNLVPRPSIKKEKIILAADVFRFYGKPALANAGVYGLDIIREDLEDGRVKKKTIQVFYNPDMEVEEPVKDEPPAETKSERIARLRQELEELEEVPDQTPVKKAAVKKPVGKKRATV